MKYQGLRRLLLVTAVVVAANAFSRGLIVTFYYDLFESCLSFDADRTSFECQYGPQVLLNTVGGLGIIAVLYALGHKTTRILNRLAPVIMGFGYVLLSMGAWRLLVALSDNFNLSMGPQTVTEYMFVILANLESLIIGLILGLAYNLLVALNRYSKPETGRRAPRLKFKR